MPKGHKILVVDDDARIVDGVARMLRDYWDVVTAYSVPQALEIIARGHVEAVLTDWNMPLGGGERVLEAALLAELPVVIYSGGLAFQDPAMAGAFCCLTKPSSTAEVDGALWRALSNSRSEVNIPVTKEVGHG